MATAEINVVFEGPNTADGVSLRDLNATFRRVQDAVRQMASHLAGVETRGRPPEWLRDQISLRLLTVFPGSFGTTLALSPGRTRHGGKDFGVDALEAIFGWSGEDDGALPPEVIDTLHSVRDEFYAREPVVFDPDKATGFYDHDDDDPVDIEAFIRVIYEARDI